MPKKKKKTGTTKRGASKALPGYIHFAPEKTTRKVKKPTAKVVSLTIGPNTISCVGWERLIRAVIFDRYIQEFLSVNGDLRIRALSVTNAGKR